MGFQNDKNGGSGVAIVAATCQPSISPVFGATSGILTSPTTAPSFDDSLTVLSQLSLPDSADYEGNQDKALVLSNQRDTGSIIDSGVTDHITYDKSFFHSMTAPTKTSVVTANGESNSVTKASSITLTPTLSLHKTFYQTVRPGGSLGVELREGGFIMWMTLHRVVFI
ncbi:unnamed protein product [Prunus armeniaca]